MTSEAQTDEKSQRMVGRRGAGPTLVLVGQRQFPMPEGRCVG